MSVREVTLDPGLDPARAAGRTPGSAVLRGRVGPVGATTAVLAAQFWGLTATLAAWQAGNGAALRGSLAFQAVCTLAAVVAGRSR